MTDFDWKAIVRTIAPALATAFGTPLAGLATKAIVDVFLPGEGGAADEAALAAAVQNATPDQLIALKQAGLQFQKDMAALGVDLERIASEDRSSARKREIDTKDPWTPRVLGGIVIIGFFIAMWFVLSGGTEGYAADVSVLVGAVVGYASAKADQVVSYYFGSSAGSARKTDMLARAKLPNEP